MSLDLTKEITRTFNLADMRHKTKSFRKPEDWEQGREIMARHQRQAKLQTQSYYAQYDTRVSQSLQRLMDKAGAPKKTLTNRFFQIDQFNKDLLLQQAHKDVQHDHHRRISRIEQHEAKDLGVLIEKIERRDEAREQTEQAFSRSAEPVQAKVPLKDQPRRPTRRH